MSGGIVKAVGASGGGIVEAPTGEGADVDIVEGAAGGGIVEGARAGGGNDSSTMIAGSGAPCMWPTQHDNDCKCIGSQNNTIF
jgi:hypothetical protein